MPARLQDPNFDYEKLHARVTELRKFHKMNEIPALLTEEGFKTVSGGTYTQSSLQYTLYDSRFAKHKRDRSRPKKVPSLWSEEALNAQTKSQMITIHPEPETAKPSKMMLIVGSSEEITELLKKGIL